MTCLDVDVLVIGAGFGGSLTALLLKRSGLRPALVDRAVHPRFALGESSTPIADFVLRELADRYDLPRLAPLAKYGPWQRTYPQIPCGLKRGFSYFQHRPGEAFQPDPMHGNELLVAASFDNDRSDTHWYRPAFDEFVCREAVAAGVPYFDAAAIQTIEPRGDGWSVTAQRGDELLSFDTKFLVDASGEGGVLARALGVAQRTDQMRTRSRTIFGHFKGVRLWREWLETHGGRTDEHPYLCDDAALHHIFEEGWMWVLRFNNGITSAGFVLDMDKCPTPEHLSPQEEWDGLMARYPAVAWQFAETQLVAPPGGLRRSGRVQRQAERFVGPGWAMLPTTAGIVDALHSSGNAHTLCGIARLAEALRRHWDKPELAAALQAYEQTLRGELALIDQIVHGCFAAFGRFDLLASFAMTYFAGASVSEQRRRDGLAAGDAFLQAHDPAFRRMVDQLHARVLALAAEPPQRPGADAAFVAEAAAALAPFNIAGLCDPAKRNMYLHTERGKNS